MNDNTNNSSVLIFLIFLSSIILFVGSPFLSIFALPFHPVEAVTLLVILSSPVAYFIVQSIPWHLLPNSERKNILLPADSFISNSELPNTNIKSFQVAFSGYRKRPNIPALKIMFACMLISMFIGAALSLNKWNDNSAAEIRMVTIIGKYTSSGRQGVIYKFSILSPVPSPLPFTLTNEECLFTSYKEYPNIIPGQSKVMLKIHKGFLGMPWYEFH